MKNRTEHVHSNSECLTMASLRGACSALLLCVALAGSAGGYSVLGPSFGTAMKACYQNGSTCGEKGQHTLEHF